MERQFERHNNCKLNFEDFTLLGEKGADCPVCLAIDPNWHCLGASHPQQTSKSPQVRQVMIYFCHLSKLSTKYFEQNVIFGGLTMKGLIYCAFCYVNAK